MAKLEKQIAQLQSDDGGPVEPTIIDITASLPRDAARFVKRPLNDIQFLVINHTGVRPEVGADRVAQAQRAKWPGIVGQYFINADGGIQQTNPIDEVVTNDQIWIYNGINIYVAGNFDLTVPTDAQLDALAQLCAWLLNKYGLAEGALRGVSEFIVTRSPGLQWQLGHHWKVKLLERMHALPAVPATSTPQIRAATELADLTPQLSQLQAQLADLQADLTFSEAERGRLQAQIDALLTNNAPVLARPAVTDISPQLPRSPGSPKKRDTSQINSLVISHTAVDPSVPAERIAQAHQRRWGAILYQYIVTADGKIVQTNGLDEVVDLSQPWLAQGVNIALTGNFSAEVPNETQIKATAALCAWLMQEYRIPAANVKGINEFIATQSPGAQWMSGKKWKDTLLAAIVKAQKGIMSTPTVAPAGDTTALAALPGQVNQLQVAPNQARPTVTVLQQERDKLQTQLQQQTSGDAYLSQGGRAQTLPLSNSIQAQPVSATVLEEQTATKRVGELKARTAQLEGGPSADVIPTPPTRPPANYSSTRH